MAFSVIHLILELLRVKVTQASRVLILEMGLVVISQLFLHELLLLLVLLEADVA